MMIRRIIALAILLISIMAQVVDGKVKYNIPVLCYSSSMTPTINCGDVLAVNTFTPEDNLTIGEIYLYRPDYRNFEIPNYYYIVHRLVNIDGDMCIFKGDSNQYADKPIECKFINFKVVGVEG